MESLVLFRPPLLIKLLEVYKSDDNPKDWRKDRSLIAKIRTRETLGWLTLLGGMIGPAGKNLCLILFYV